MPYQKTLAQLRESVLIRCSCENSIDLTPTVVDEVVNDAIIESYDIIVACRDDYYVKISPSFQLVMGQATYPLPVTDFYDLRKVEIAMDAAQTRWQRLLPTPLDGENRVTQFGLVQKRYRYRLSNQGLTFSPMPMSPSVDWIRIYYLPLAPQLVNDADTITFDRPAEQKLVLHVALRDVYQRQDLPLEEIEAKIAQLSKQLRTVSDSHDDGEPFVLSRRGPEEDDWHGGIF